MVSNFMVLIEHVVAKKWIFDNSGLFGFANPVKIEDEKQMAF